MNTDRKGRRLAGVAAVLVLAGCASTSGIEPQAQLREAPLAQASAIAREQAQQRQALAAAEGAYDIALQRYRGGLGTYLHVLAAETAVLAQRRLGVELAARALDTRVTLYRALGGGYAADAAVAGNPAGKTTP